MCEMFNAEKHPFSIKTSIVKALRSPQNKTENTRNPIELYGVNRNENVENEKVLRT